MASKAQKKQTQKYNEEIKAAKERMKNPTPQMVVNLENYVVYQILYANDAACNQIKFLAPHIEKVEYVSELTRKRLKTIYNALMKRVNAYWEMINASDVDQSSLAELFANMDVYTDENIDNLRNAIDDVLIKHKVEQHEWVAKVEAALVMCQYAVQIGVDLLDRLQRLPNTHPATIRKLLIVEVLRVMDDFSKFVAEAAHLGNTLIDLNKEPTVEAAFRKLNITYIKPENYTKALAAANKENEAEGRMLL